MSRPGFLVHLDATAHLFIPGFSRGYEQHFATDFARQFFCVAAFPAPGSPDE
jgi:hypothetical protein